MGEAQTTIDEIKILINENKLDGVDGAYEKFENYLKEAKQKYGSFNKNKWLSGWRLSIYKFGQLFETKDASQFITILNKILEEDIENNEVIEFIKSELMWNYFPKDSDFAKEYFEELLKKYPCNPEFHHSYSHYLERNENYEKAISECRLALKIEPQNREFLITCFDREKIFFDQLIFEGQIFKAEKQFQNMQTFELYTYNSTFNYALFLLKDRLNDHKVIDNKIAKIDNIITQKTEEERRRLIEILGIFAAILGFIFTNVNIALNSLNFEEMLWLMLEMAAIFLIFGISMSYIFQKDKNSFYKEGKFWILIALFLVIIISIFFI